MNVISKTLLIAAFMGIVNFSDIQPLIVKSPSFENNYESKRFTCNSSGTFPNQQDCRKFWYCKNSDRKGAVDATNNLTKKVFRDKHTSYDVMLYKCPKGYLYDEHFKFCLPSSKVKCSYPKPRIKKKEMMTLWRILNDFRLIQLS